MSKTLNNLTDIELKTMFNEITSWNDTGHLMKEALLRDVHKIICDSCGYKVNDYSLGNMEYLIPDEICKRFIERVV